jgi:hypothetical protein
VKDSMERRYSQSQLKQIIIDLREQLVEQEEAFDEYKAKQKLYVEALVLQLKEQETKTKKLEEFKDNNQNKLSLEQENKELMEEIMSLQHTLKQNSTEKEQWESERKQLEEQINSIKQQNMNKKSENHDSWFLKNLKQNGAITKSAGNKSKKTDQYFFQSQPHQQSRKKNSNFLSFKDRIDEKAERE